GDPITPSATQAHRIPRKPYAPDAPVAPDALGTQRMYTLRSLHTYTLSAAEHEGVRVTLAPDADPTLTFQLDGVWVHTLCEHEHGLTHVQLQLQQAHLQVRGGNQDADQLKAIRNDLDRVHFMTLTSSNAIAVTHFPNDIHPTSRMLLKSLIAATQNVHPEDPTALAWDTEEQDLNGIFTAHYQREDMRITKSAKRYQSIASPQGLRSLKGFSQYTREGATVFKTNPDSGGWPSHIDVDERLKVTPQGGGLSIDLKEQLSFSLLKTHHDSTRVDAFSQLAHTLSEHPLMSAEDLMAVQGSPHMAAPQQSYAQLAAQLESEQDTKRRARLLHTLTRVFQHNPGAIDEATTAIIHGVWPTPMAQEVLGAISSAATPAAQRALVTLSRRDTLDDLLQINALNGLALVPKPTSETLAALVEQVETHTDSTLLHNTTALTLGAASGHALQKGTLGDNDPFSTLVHRLHAAQTPQEQQLYIEAIGNARDPRSLAILKPFLKSSATHLRAASVASLRWTPNAEADILILTLLRADPSPAVRKSAVFALTFRPELQPVFGIIAHIARNDDSPQVRLDLIPLLARHHALRPTLTWLSKHDPNRQVRHVALQALPPS
ncbi:MAG: HEAT repeat domain-containing protein, partial [Myxococcota bacterium]